MTWGMSRHLDARAAAWPMAARVERQAQLMGEVMRRVAVDPEAAAREGRGIAFARRKPPMPALPEFPGVPPPAGRGRCRRSAEILPERGVLRPRKLVA